MLPWSVEQECDLIMPWYLVLLGLSRTSVLHLQSHTSACGQFGESWENASKNTKLRNERLMELIPKEAAECNNHLQEMLSWKRQWYGGFISLFLLSIKRNWSLWNTCCCSDVRKSFWFIKKDLETDYLWKFSKLLQRILGKGNWPNNTYSVSE